MTTRRYVLAVDASGVRDLDTGISHDPFATYQQDPLRHLVWSSLYSDAQLSATEQPELLQRGGWWPGVQYGSTLHAQDIRRGVLTARTLATIQDAAKQALQWLVADGVAQSVDVDVRRDEGRASVAVVLTGPSTSTVGARYTYLWGNQ